MNVATSLVKVVVLFCWIGHVWVDALWAQPEKVLPSLNLAFEVDSQRLSSGLTYTHYQSDTLNGSPLSIHVLELDLRRHRLEVALAMDQLIGQETTSSMVERKGALAGVNGGFSFSNDPWNLFHGDPRDLLVKEGKVLSEPHLTRASLLIHTQGTEQQLRFQQLGWAGKVCTKQGACLSLSGINRIRREDELLLYTPEFHRSTLTPEQGLEVVVRKNKVKEVRPGRGASLIPADGYVLSASGVYVDSLQRLLGKKLRLSHECWNLRTPGQRISLEEVSAQTAGPVLIREGKVVEQHEDEQIPLLFTNTRHPRTAVGVGKEAVQVWLVVVDGRQPGLSMGMSLPELSTFLLKLGAQEAYNLDGGGSSTMVADERILNSPSDPKERRRCDALLVFPKF